LPNPLELLQAALFLLYENINNNIEINRKKRTQRNKTQTHPSKIKTKIKKA
jgi:hypothetical protein